jgi:hypothetical protein
MLYMMFLRVFTIGVAATKKYVPPSSTLVLEKWVHQEESIKLMNSRVCLVVFGIVHKLD